MLLFPAATEYVTPDAIDASHGVVDGRASELAAEAHVRHGRVDRIVRDPLDALDHLGGRPLPPLQPRTRTDTRLTFFATP